MGKQGGTSARGRPSARLQGFLRKASRQKMPLKMPSRIGAKAVRQVLSPRVGLMKRMRLHRALRSQAHRRVKLLAGAHVRVVGGLPDAPRRLRADRSGGLRRTGSPREPG
jgi:hypothetical protein